MIGEAIPSEEEIARRIAPYGDTDRGIRKSKPEGESGLIQFLWRMCSFHSGQNPHMPVTAYWWLQRWIDDQGIDASVSGIHDERGKEILNELDGVAANVLWNQFGKSDLEAAKRWKRAGLL